MAKQNATTKSPRQPRAQVTAAKPAAKAERQANTEAGLFVRSFPATFRRAGFEFNQRGFGLRLQDLSKAQLEAILSEPMLHVTECDFPTTEADDELLQQEANDQGNQPPADNSTTENPQT